jgi:hypothetical protein
MFPGVLYATQHGFCLLSMVTPDGDMSRAAEGKAVELHLEAEALAFVLLPKRVSSLLTPTGRAFGG